MPAPAAKFAVTFVLPASVTWHDPAPLHPPPLHPAKVEVAFGAAVRVTGMPFWKLAEQVAPQAIPDGLLVTVPPPLPPSASDKVLVGGGFWVRSR